MIKIKQGVYGHYNGSSVEPKDKNSEPFALSPEQEERLVEQGIAVYVDEAPELISEEIMEEPRGVDAALEDMTAKELREYGKTLGLTFKVGIKNAEMIAEIMKHLNENSEDPDEAGEEAESKESEPKFDPAEAVQ